MGAAINRQTRRIVTIHDEREAARHARGRVIVTEDGGAVREAPTGLLSLAGYAVVPFSSASGYLDSLGEALPLFPGPQCVLLDIKMPDINGLELQRRLGEMGEPASIVFMSGGSGAFEVVQALKNGTMDFLRNPFETEYFLTAVAHALKKTTTNSNTASSISILAADYPAYRRGKGKLPRSYRPACLNVM